MGGEDEAGAQVLGVGDGFQALLGVRGHLTARRCQQVGVGLVVAATDAAAQLVQLGQAELVGALDEDGVGAGHVDAGLDDGRGHQHVEALVVEVAHHLFQLALVHLSVADADARLRDQFGEVAGALLDGLHFVVQVVHLAAAQQFAEQRFVITAFCCSMTKVRTDRRRAGGVAMMDGSRMPETAMFRVRGIGVAVRGEDVHFAAQGLELLLLAHPEAVFLVDHDQPRLANFTSSWSSLWVPMRMSILPSASSRAAFSTSLALLKRLITSTLTGQSAKRSRKLL